MATSRPIRALVIDDSAYNRVTLSRMLESHPHIKVVATAVNGEDGIKQVMRHRPDVITLDLEMPSFWEAELWRETRQFDDVAHVLSAYETRRTRGGELLNLGVNSIQLLRRDGRWWISAMIWRREGANVRIPRQSVATR